MKNNPITAKEKPGTTQESQKQAVAHTANQDGGDKLSVEEIAKRAYFIFLKRGSVHGHDVSHWLEAETQLLDERTSLYVGSHLITD